MNVERRLAAVPEPARLLGRVLSLAVRIEPELVRRARRLFPRLDASAEAALWFGPLVEARTPRGINLYPELADVLRAELAQDPDLLERAWRLVEASHRDASWAIRLEEKIRYLSLSPAPQARERVKGLLAAAGQQVQESDDPQNTARWLARALPQMPASVREGGEARALEAGTALRLTGWLDSAWIEELSDEASEAWLPWAVPDDLPRISVPVRLLEGALEIGEEAWEGGQTLVLPGTQPRALEVTWYEGTRPVRRWVTWEEGETRRVAIGSDWVELATLTGERYRLRDAERTTAVGSTGSGTDELDFGPLKAKHRPFLDREEVMEELEQWVGRRSVHVDGASGIGKTALLCALVDRLEASRRPCIYHFVAEEVPGSEDPERAERSLVAQLRRYFPELPGHLDLEKALARVSEEEALARVSEAEALATYEDTGPTLPVIVLDGDVLTLDRFAGSAFVQRLVFSEVRGRLIVSFVHLLLDQKVESNNRLCQSYLELHGEEVRRLATTESHLPPEQILLDRARGVIGRLVAMREWLSRHGLPPVPVEQIPPTLYDGGAESLHDLGLDLEAVARVLSVLTVAREAIPYLAFRELSPPLERKYFHEIVVRLAMTGWVRVPGKRLEEWVDERDDVVWPRNPPNVGPRYEVTDESVARFLEGHLGEELELAHRALAEALPQRHDNTGQSGWELAYGRKHAWWHLLQGGEVERLEELLTDVEYLAWVVEELGVEALVERLETAAEVSDRPVFGNLVEAVRRVAPRLEQHPRALPSLLVNHPDFTSFGFTTLLHSRDRRPWLRLRHRLVPEVTYAPAPEPETVHCAGDLDGSGRMLVTGMEKDVQLWDVVSASQVASLPQAHHGAVRGEDDLVVTAQGNDHLYLWSLSGESLGTLSTPGRVTALTLAGATLMLAATRDPEGGGSRISGWDRILEAGWVPGPGWHVPYAVHALSTGGKDLAAIAGDGGLELWSTSDSNRLRTFEGAGRALCCDLTFSGEYLLSGSDDGRLSLWDAATGRLLLNLRGHEAPVRACRLGTRQPRLAVSAGEDGTVRLWDLESGELLETVYGDRPFMDLTASRDLSMIVAVDAAAVGWVLDRTGPVDDGTAAAAS